MDQYEPQSHCHKCGTAYVRDTADQEWPRRCPNCRNLQWFNPTPIGVMLQRVTDGDRIGIATPIRGHAPMRGKPGITGGFHDGWDQSSEDAGSREINEEIGLERVLQDDAELITTQSTGPFIPGRRQLLVFSLSPVIVPISRFDDFRPDAETLAMHYSWAPEVLAFPSHTRALAIYFKRHHGIEPPRQYVEQPKTGDPVVVGAYRTVVFEVPYDQPLLDQGFWSIVVQDGGDPVAVRAYDGVWVGAS